MATGTIAQDKNNITVEQVDASTRRFSLYGFALCVAVIILLVVIFLKFYRYITIPIIAYFMSVVFGLANQMVVCGKIQITQLFSLSVLVPIFTGIGIAISKIPLMSYPIEALIPNSKPETKADVAAGFYAFWGALYAQLVAGGFLQICPTQSNMPKT